MTSYRVTAHNTSKQSENKIHDDTVARRFGFSGGLVPGVDVFAYMTHLPVEKWGRAFLERGLMDARFVKPVYDGEVAELTGTETGGILSIEVHSRGALCATGTARLCRRPRRDSLSPISGKSPPSPNVIRSMPAPTKSANGSARSRATGRAIRHANISPISGKPIRFTHAKASAIPACCSG